MKDINILFEKWFNSCSLKSQPLSNEDLQMIKRKSEGYTRMLAMVRKMHPDLIEDEAVFEFVEAYPGGCDNFYQEYGFAELID